MPLRPLLALLLLPGLALAHGVPTPPPATSSPPPAAAPVDPAAPPPSGAPAAAGPAGTPPSPPAPAPFGAPLPPAPPRLEVGLMVSETAFGALTAAGTALLPYLLATRTPLFDSLSGGQPLVKELLTLAAVAGTPLAVASTELGIANQSRDYVAEAWPAQLAGLGTQAAVVGLFYLMGGFPQTGLLGIGRTNGEVALLIGTLGLVPIAEMVAINLTKTPRSAVPFGGLGAVSFTPEGGLHVAAPVPQPLFAPGEAGALAGVLVPVASGRF